MEVRGSKTFDTALSLGSSQAFIVVVHEHQLTYGYIQVEGSRACILLHKLRVIPIYTVHNPMQELVQASCNAIIDDA